MKKIFIWIISYIGIALFVAFMVTAFSGSFQHFINCLIISSIFAFSIGIFEQLIFVSVKRINPSIMKIRAYDILLGIIGVFIGTEIAIIIIKYILHITMFYTFTGHLIILLLTLLIGIIITISTMYHHEMRYKLEKREMEIERLKRLQIESKYAILQSKINPHFLFNTLSTMAGMVYIEPEKVEKIILNLSSVYRKILSMSEKMITIEDELEIVRKYLDIEKIRMGERLNYNISVENDALQCKIPSMIIEMLVENSVLHGIAPKKEGGNINIFINRNDDSVVIRIKDDGVGMDNNKPKGFALDNIKNRLKFMLKESKFSIVNNSIGVTVSMEFICENESDNR